MSTCNTFSFSSFQTLYTSKLPADKRDTHLLNQIDFILIKTRLRNSMMSIKTEADVPSDNNPLICKLCTRFKKIKSRHCTERLDVWLLHNIETKKQIQKFLDKRLKDILPFEDKIQETWKVFKDTITNNSDKFLTPKKKQKRKETIKNEMLTLMK